MSEQETILKELKSVLTAQFGDDIADIILFGSQAAGTAHRHSDYDILIILNRNFDRKYEGDLIAALLEIELKYDLFIDPKFISTHQLQHSLKGKHPLYVDAIREGVHL